MVTRILIDATNCEDAAGGLRTYTRGLAEALAARTDVSVSVATRGRRLFSEVDGIAAINAPRLTRHPVVRALWREANLSRIARRTRADVLLAAGHELPLVVPNIPSIVVIHDIGPIVMPQLFPRGQVVRHTWALKRICNNATRIVCVSAATSDAVKAAFDVDPDKCVVIGEGPQVVASSMRHERGPFVLYVGATYPHKNVITLVRAFGDPALANLRLRMVGPPPRTPELRAAIESLGAERVVHEGVVSLERLQNLYATAFAVALPSLHEGFGLPVLEASLARTPVVVTDLPSIREIVSDGAEYVTHPMDAAAWSEALAALWHNEPRRRYLAQRAFEHASRYSWKAVADQFASLAGNLVPTGRVYDSSAGAGSVV